MSIVSNSILSGVTLTANAANNALAAQQDLFSFAFNGVALQLTLNSAVKSGVPVTVYFAFGMKDYTGIETTIASEMYSKAQSFQLRSSTTNIIGVTAPYHITARYMYTWLSYDTLDTAITASLDYIGYAFSQSGSGGGGDPATATLQNTAITKAETSIVADFSPGYGGSALTGTRAANTIDPDDYQISRSTVLTDERCYRANFANTSLAVTVGTCTVTNGGTVVTGTGFIAADIRHGDYFKLNADAETAWVQIDQLTDTTITLTSAYTGVGGTGTGARSIMAPSTGVGATVSVASGVATIASGTTTGSVSEIERTVDYLPVIKQAGVTISQRIANQTTYIGFYDETSPLTPKWFAWFKADGTTNTTVICESARNPTTAPSAAETEQTTVTLPNGRTTATSNRYRIEVLGDRVIFLIEGIRVAVHYRAMPGPGDVLTSTVRITNGTSPASNTNVLIDYDTCKNHNKLEVGLMSDAETVVAMPPPQAGSTYSVAGVITVNTDLMVFDCSNFASIGIQCSSMGTAGVVTPVFSNDPTFTTPITPTLVTPVGATAATFNAAGAWMVPVVGKYMRLRLTTATTAGTTTIYAYGSPFTTQVWLSTQPVSGTVAIGATVTPGVGATNLGKAEDAVAASGDTGVFVLGVRRDVAVASANAAGDYNELAVGQFGDQYMCKLGTRKRSYSCAFTVVPAASATDIVEIIGSASTVEITRITVGGIQTTAGQVLLSLIRRSTASTAGTSTTATMVPHQATDIAATAVVKIFTANPTVGTIVAAIRSRRLPIGTTTSLVTPTVFDFGENTKPIFLAGVTQTLCLNLGGVTVTGGSLDVEIEFTEF